MAIKQQELTVRQAAKILGKSSDNVRHYIRSGQLPYLRMVGPQYMLDLVDVRRFKPQPVGHPPVGKNNSVAAKPKPRKTCEAKRRNRK